MLLTILSIKFLINYLNTMPIHELTNAKAPSMATSTATHTLFLISPPQHSETGIMQTPITTFPYSQSQQEPTLTPKNLGSAMNPQ